MKKQLPEITGPSDRRKLAFVEGLIEGKSMRQAALAAGYAPSTAESAYRAILPGVKQIFQDALHRHISVGKLAKRISEGIDAEETKFFQKDGIVTDKRDVIAWSERREYSELAAKLFGFATDKLSLTGEEGGPLAIEIVVKHVGS